MAIAFSGANNLITGGHFTVVQGSQYTESHPEKGASSQYMSVLDAQ
jgi:hypothetical protein